MSVFTTQLLANKLFLLKRTINLYLSFNFLKLFKKFRVQRLHTNFITLLLKIEHTTEFHGSPSDVKGSAIQYRNEFISTGLSPTCLILVCVSIT